MAGRWPRLPALVLARRNDEAISPFRLAAVRTYYREGRIASSFLLARTNDLSFY
jgi:hypothetical protein